MKSLMYLVLFIVMLNVVTSAKQQCTTDKIRRCCANKCKYPYCNPKTGGCGCGDNTLFSDQCPVQNKCTSQKITSCCSKRCMGPYCDPLTESCGCGDNTLSSQQCSIPVSTVS